MELAMRVVELHPDSRDEWDHPLRSSPEANLGQSYYWAQVIKRIDQAKPIYLRVEDSEGGITASLLMHHRRHYDRHKRKSRWRSIWQKGWLEWFDGPVLLSRESSEGSLRALLTWIDGYAEMEQIDSLRMLGWAHVSDFVACENMKSIFTEQGYEASKWGTFLVDLTPNEETMWGKLHHSARKSVHKCRRQAVRIRQIRNLEDYRVFFYQPYAAAERHSHRRANPFYVSKVMFEEDTIGYYAYFVAQSEGGDVLGTLGMYMFNGVATEIASSLAPDAYKGKIPAQDLLHWEMMLYAKACGCHTFDLAGVNPEPSNGKELGIRRFKEKWGGRYVEYYRFSKIFPARNAMTKTWRLLREAKRALRGFLTHA